MNNENTQTTMLQDMIKQAAEECAVMYVDNGFFTLEPTVGDAEPARADIEYLQQEVLDRQASAAEIKLFIETFRSALFRMAPVCAVHNHYNERVPAHDYRRIFIAGKFATYAVCELCCEELDAGHEITAECGYCGCDVSVHKEDSHEDNLAKHHKNCEFLKLRIQ